MIVVTGPENVADGTVAMHAGADDHLVRGSIPPGMLPRAIRYAVTVRRLRRELSTQDDETGLPNLRGFAPIAEHHLRMADRAHQPAVFLFVRIEGLRGAVAASGADEAAALARDAAALVLEAVRDADVPARISADTFCVLLTGEAHGAEAFVLSRLVEAIAVNDARLGPLPPPFALGRERPVRPRSPDHAGADLLERGSPIGRTSRPGTIRGPVSCEYGSNGPPERVRDTRSSSELGDGSTHDRSPERAGGGHRPR